MVSPLEGKGVARWTFCIKIVVELSYVREKDGTNWNLFS